MAFWKRTLTAVRQHAQRMDALLDAYATVNSFSGVVRIAQGDELIFERALGMASAELNVPNNLSHTFRIGSISKSLTALAIMQLAEQGRLTLDGRVAQFVPDYPEGEVRVRHLLTNSSGIPDYLMLEGAGPWYAQPAAPAELIDRFRNLPLLFAPGSRLSYSNSNWVLLTAILQAVSGESYGVYLRKHLLDPLGMAHTAHEESGAVAPWRATGYSLRDGQPAPALPLDPSVCIGAGSLYASAADLGRLDRGLAQAQLWQPATLAAMWAPAFTTEDGSQYGLGFQMGERFGRRWNGHSGSIFGYTAFFTRYPDDDALVVVLSNYENGSAGRIEQDLAAILFDQPYILPAPRIFVQVAREQLLRFTGRYLSTFMGRPIPFEITLEGGELYARFVLLPKAHLRPLADNRFFTELKGGEVEFTFGGPAPAPATHIDIDWSGYRSVAPRIEEQKAA